MQYPRPFGAEASRRTAQMIRRAPEPVSAPSRRAVCLDNCKTSHTLRLLRLTDESLRQRSFEWEPKNERPQTFVEWVLALLEERFPWLGSGQDEPVGGADTVDELADLYKSLIEQRDKARRENGDPRA